MSYEVVFRDNSIVTISEKLAETLKQRMLDASADTSTVVQLGGDVHRLYDIRSVRHIIEPQMGTPHVTGAHQLGAGRQCRGQHSIQHEINQYLKKRHPRDWPRLIQDTTTRETVRAAIRKQYPDRSWCDYRSNECGCD